MSGQVEALLHELEHVKLRPGMEERVESIKAELKALGHRAGSVSDGPSDEVETATPKKARK